MSGFQYVVLWMIIMSQVTGLLSLIMRFHVHTSLVWLIGTALSGMVLAFWIIPSLFEKPKRVSVYDRYRREVKSVKVEEFND